MIRRKLLKDCRPVKFAWGCALCYDSQYPPKGVPPHRFIIAGSGAASDYRFICDKCIKAIRK